MLGLVDGSTAATTRRFNVILAEEAVVQLDDLVTTRQALPDGTEVTHYGIVVEALGNIEGAQLPSDTQRITGTQTMPGLTTRTVTVNILRASPELWVPPAPGARVERAAGRSRDEALFLDQMSQPIPIGFDQHLEPIKVDFAFANGEKGGHLSISGISGVATKTSFALLWLYMLFETPLGEQLLGSYRPLTRSVVFNVKGEDLLHIDKPNNKFSEEHKGGWAALGVPEPGPFTDVEFFAPQSARAHDGARATDVQSRAPDDIRTFGWTPWDFIRGGLLRFCFDESVESRNQVPFLEQRVRAQLARYAYPSTANDGSVVMVEPPEHTSYNLERVVEERRQPKRSDDGRAIRSFSDLLDYLTDQVSPDHNDPSWTAGVQAGTMSAFLRRLYALAPRLGQLVTTNVATIQLARSVTVVDLHSLHDDAQRFVVGALLAQIFSEKQGAGREPLRFVVLDELNKYAPREGKSPIKEMLIDIAARGRSLGVILVGAQQVSSNVERAILDNAAIKVVGRLDAASADEYRFLSVELRERASRFLPGTMVLDQPLVPAPIPFRFPFPAYATCVSEDATGEHRLANPAVIEELLADL